MGERCPICDREECGHFEVEKDNHRLRYQVRILEEANRGWRRHYAEAAKETAQGIARELEEEAQEHACKPEETVYRRAAAIAAAYPGEVSSNA